MSYKSTTWSWLVGNGPKLPPHASTSMVKDFILMVIIYGGFHGEM